MKQEIIRFIVNNAHEKLRLIAVENKLDEECLFHIVEDMLKNNGSTEAMSAAEMELFKLFIHPLIEKGFCDGALAFVEQRQNCEGKVFTSDGTVFRCAMDGECKCRVL